MKVSSKWLVTLAAGVVGLALIGGTTLAADPTPTATGVAGGADCTYAGMGRGAGMGMGGMQLAPIAKALNVTTDQLAADIKAGKSIAEIAKAKGVSEDAVVEATLAPTREMLQIRVKYGQLTQDQANQMQERMTTQLRQHLSQTTPTPGAGNQWGGRMGRGGMMGGGRAI